MYVVHLKRQSDLQASYTHLTQNFTRNSMVAIIFVKDIRLRNGGHFKIRSPNVGMPFVTKRWVWEKKWKKIDPHYFSILEGAYFFLFFSDSPFDHNWHPDFGGPNFKMAAIS